jgi:hypothetical protein
MPTLGQLLGDNLYNVAYGPQYNAMKRKQALDDSGYIPSENDGLIDSFQSGLAGSMGGLFGELSGWAKNNGHDWLANEAMYNANQMGDIAARNAYTGNADTDGYLWYGANQAAQALGSSVPSLATDVATSAAADAAIGSIVPGVGTTAGGVVGALTGVGKFALRAYEGSKAIRYGIKAAKTAGSIAVGGLVENASNAGDTYMTGLSRGMDYDEAWNASNQSFDDGWAPAVLNYASDKISLGMPMKGISAAMAVGTGGKVLAKTAGAWAGNAMIGATGEGLTEAWQQEIQEQALGNPDYANVHIYDPRTWTDEMMSQGKDAFAGSLVLGGIGGAVNTGRGWASSRSNPSVSIEDSIDSRPQEISLNNTTNINDVNNIDIEDDVYGNVEAPVSAVRSLKDNTDVDGITDLSEIVPDQLAPQERGDYDDVLDTMTARFQKNKYSDSDITSKQQAVSDTVNRIIDLWDNSTDETTPKKLTNNMYMDDFINAGLTKKEAHEASSTLVSTLRKKNDVDNYNPMDGKNIVERADKVGYKLSDAQRKDLLSNNPIRQNINDTNLAVEKAEADARRRQQTKQAQQREQDNRQAYSSRYKDSVNKPFLDPLYGDRAEETGYRISKAIAEREADKKYGRKVRKDYEYLRKNGINTQNYSEQEMKDIQNHVRSIEQGKKNNDKTGLLKRSADNANVIKANQAYAEAFKNLDENDPRDKAKIQQTREVIANQLVELGKMGKPIHRYEVLKDLKKNSKNLYNKVMNEVYGEQIAEAKKQVKVEKPKIQANANVKPSFKKGSISAKVAENPELKPLITAQSIDVEKAKKVQPKEVIKKEAKQEVTSVKETKKRGPYKNDKTEGERALAGLREQKITPQEAIKYLSHLEKNANNKYKPELRKMIEMVRYNTNKDGKLKNHDRSPEGKEKEAQIIRDRIAKFQNKLDTEKVTNQGYQNESQQIQKQIDKFNFNHLGDTKEYNFEIPQHKNDTSANMVEAHVNGEIKHPAYVRDAIFKTPSAIDKSVFKWLSKELGQLVTSFRDGERNKIIKTVLTKEYENLIEGAGGPIQAFKSNPSKVKQLVYAIAGSFPKQSFGLEGNRIRDDRNKKMYDGKDGLTKTPFDEKDKLIAFAKQYFKTGFEKKDEVVEQPKVIKEDKRKENRINKQSPITLSKVTPTDDREVFHFELNVKPNTDITATLENIGVDTDSITNKTEKNGKVSFDAELMLSSTPFDGKSASNLKDYATKSAVQEAREQILKAAISNSDTGSLIFYTDSTAGLQKTLDKLYGKGEYVIDELDGQVLLRPKNVSVEKALEDPLSYQKGKEETTETQQTENVNTSDLSDIINRGLNKSDNLTPQQASVLFGALKSRLGNQYPKVINYLNKAKHIEIQVTDAGETPQYNSALGVIYIPEDRINSSSTSFQHELVHAALRDYLNNAGSTKQVMNFASSIADYIKEEIDGYRNFSQPNTNRNEMSEGRVAQDGTQSGGLHERVLSTQQNEALLSREHANEDSNMRGTNMPSRSSGEGVQRQGNRLESTQLGNNRGRTELYRQRQTIPHDRGNQGGFQTANSISKRPNFEGGLLRAWDSAKDVVNKATKDTLFGIRNLTINRVNNTIRDEELSVKDKENIVLSLLWQAKELDKKFNIPYEGSLMRAVYEGNRSNLEETLAYTLQGNLAPVHTGALFESASKVTNPKPLIENREEHPEEHYAIMLHRESTGYLRKSFHQGKIIEPSVSYSLGKDAYNSVLDGYGEYALVLDPKQVVNDSYVLGTQDMYTKTINNYDSPNEYGGMAIDGTRLANKALAFVSDKPKRLSSNKISVSNARNKPINILDAMKVIDKHIRPVLKEHELRILEDSYDNDILSFYDDMDKPRTTIKPIIDTLYRMRKGESIEEGYRKVTRGQQLDEQTKKAIEGLRQDLKQFGTGYGEAKLHELNINDIKYIVLDETHYKQLDSYIERGANMRGIPIITITDDADNKAQYVMKEIVKLEKQKAPEDVILYQKGKEVNPIANALPSFAEAAAKLLKKEDDNITFETRDAKQGNISGYTFKKWLRSPIKMIEKYIPQMKPIIHWATEAEVKADKLQRVYLKALDKIKTNLGEDNIKSFNKLAKQVTVLGREFVQPVGVMVRDREVYINLDMNDTFREFKDEVDAKNLYNELKNQGKHAFMDYKDGNFRVFASDKAMKPFATWEQAHKASLPLRNKAIREQGYNGKVLQAYNAWRQLDDRVFNDSVKAWQASGADPEHKPRKLWGHVPMLHSRYGVYLAREATDDKGDVYEKREKIASFHTYRDAEHYVKDKKLNKDLRIIITERNPRYDENVSSDIYEGSNESAYDDIVYEGESREQQEKRFARISHSYPALNKIIDEFVNKKDGVTREKLMDLIQDKKKQKDLGIDSKQLNQELQYANLDELFRRRDVITRQDLIGHLLLGYGNLRKDKYNNVRTNAKGANPDVFGNIENYLRYKAHFIPTNEFYHKSTSLYRDVIGTDYASQFGRNGEGARRDVEDVLHNFISSVIGVPNNADKTINRTVNELIGDGWIKQHYGETFATDLMNRSMEAVTVAKLGLFRPTAALAQLGALMNIVTKTGYTKDFAQAVRDATMFGPSTKNITMAERRMFNNIGLNLQDTAMETQSLKNRKSIYNMKVGKVKLGKLFEKSMDMFNRMDKYTRRVAALHAFRRAIAEGKSQTEAEHIASDFVRETNFDYSDKDASQLFTKYGTLGKLILQFKKYSIKELEFMYDIVKSGNKKEMARFLGSYMTMAGLMGIPGISLADPFAEWISNKKATDSIKETIMEWAGNDKTKKQLALLAMYGLPAPTIGADFSRNIGVGDLVPTDNFFGPTFGTLGNMMDSFRNHNTANNVLLGMAHDLSPAFANYYQGATGKKHDWTKGVDTRDYSSKERVLKMLGFRPILDSVNSDMSSINYANSQNEKSSKKQLIYQYINDPKSVSVEELKAMNITKKNISDAKKALDMSASDKLKHYGTKASKAKNKEKADKFAGFEEELD